MPLHTTIEWCDSTVNLSMGCDGCELWNRSQNNLHCYAGQMTDRYGGKHGGFPRVFEEPKLFLQRLGPVLKWPDLTGTEREDKPWLNGMPRLIFVGDMSDTWTESLNTEDWMPDCLEQMARTPHQWLMLTKRPSRMAAFSRHMALPPNVWPMTTVTSQKTVKRVAALLKVQGGGPKGVSCEPLLGPIDLSAFMTGEVGGSRIDWVITGGESGRKARWTHPAWFRRLEVSCLESRTPFFLKQIGEWTSEAPENARFRDVRIDLMGRDVTTEPGLWGEDDAVMYRVGKKHAGRLLDGREFNQMPVIGGAA